MVAFQLDPLTNGYINIYSAGTPLQQFSNFGNCLGACPILRPPDERSRLTGKTMMPGKSEGRRRRGDRG